MRTILNMSDIMTFIHTERRYKHLYS